MVIQNWDRLDIKTISAGPTGCLDCDVPLYLSLLGEFTLPALQKENVVFVNWSWITKTLFFVWECISWHLAVMMGENQGWDSLIKSIVSGGAHICWWLKSNGSELNVIQRALSHRSFILCLKCTLLQYCDPDCLPTLSIAKVGLNSIIHLLSFIWFVTFFLFIADNDQPCLGSGKWWPVFSLPL